MSGKATVAKRLGGDVHRLAGGDTADVRFVDVNAHPNDGAIRDRHDRRIKLRRHALARLAMPPQDDAGDRRAHECLLVGRACFGEPGPGDDDL